MKRKECTGCHKVKSLSSFYKRTASVDGKMYQCKECHDAACQIYNEAHPEKRREYSQAGNAKRAEWAKENPEEHRRICQEWKKKNPEKVKMWAHRAYLKRKAKGKK